MAQQKTERTQAVGITGAGLLCSVARNRQDFARALAEGLIDFVPPSRLELDLDVVVGEIPSAWWPPPTGLPAETPTGLLCLQAAQECLADAQQNGSNLPPDGLVVGTSTGGQSNNEAALTALLVKQPPTIRFLQEGVIASPTRLLSQQLNIRGPVNTLSTACTSSANAIALGAFWLRQGRCRRVLVGGGDALCATTIASFYGLQLTGPHPCRPFGPQRPGMTLGEGAAFLLLEPLDLLQKEGRPWLAELVGVGMSSDAWHMTAPDKEGRGARLAMERALDDARLAPQDIAYVNAHGTGTRLNDAAEALAIQQLFGALPVSSIKGLTGHTLGGAGAIEAVLAVEVIRQQQAPPNFGADAPGDDCPLQLIQGAPASYSCPPIVLSNSFAFGGNNCSLLFCPPKPSSPAPSEERS